MQKPGYKILLLVITAYSLISGCQTEVNVSTESRKEKAINSLAKNDSTFYLVEDAMKLNGLNGISP